MVECLPCRPARLFIGSVIPNSKFTYFLFSLPSKSKPKLKSKMKSSYDYLTGKRSDWKGFQQRNISIKELGGKIRNRTRFAGNRYGVVSKVVDIFSDGTRMSATIWKPENALQNQSLAKFPGIVLCHGWGGIRDGLEARARMFARAGFVALTFDYRGWNDSDGVLVSYSSSDTIRHPNTKVQDEARKSDFSHGSGFCVNVGTSLHAHVVRQVVDMDWQLTDIEAALDYLDGEQVVDSTRIGIWGISQGGGHVITIGARHRGRVKAIVSCVPSCGDVGAGDPKSRAEEARQDAIARARGLERLSVPCGVEKGHITGMDGVPNLRKLCRYRPLDTAHLIECPMLVIGAEDEEIFDQNANGFRAYEIVRVKNPGSKFQTLEGRHYDAYDGRKDQFTKGTKLAVAFFQQHLALQDSKL